MGEFVQFAGGVLERQVIGARCHQINAGDVFTHGYWGLPLAPLKEIRKGSSLGKTTFMVVIYGVHFRGHN